MTDQWCPVGITSIRTPDGDIVLHNERGEKIPFTLRQRICDAINGAAERKAKRRLLSKEQLAKCLP